MGYYSDVKLITTREGWDKLDKAVLQVADHDAVAEGNHLTHESQTVPLEGGKYVLAEWDNIKWYEGHDIEVTALMKALRNLPEDTPYEFMRVGENLEDVEYLWNTPEYLSPDYGMPSLGLKREIEVNY